MINMNMSMNMYMNRIDELQPRVPEWAQAEKMEISYAQIDLWKTTASNTRAERKGV